MKANPSRPRLPQPPRPARVALAAMMPALIPVMLVAGCATAPAPPAPPPATPVAATQRPAQRPAPRAPEPQDWRDAPISPGEWRWAREGDTSVARFGEQGQTPRLVLRCSRAAGQITVTMVSPPTATGPLTMILITSTLTRQLTATPESAAEAGIAMFGVAIAARDPLLDAIAFSRGRWRIELEEAHPLTLPNWPPVVRVIEDCR